MIATLTEFAVVPEYHRSRTVYHVHADGEPVAQARSDQAPDSLHPLEVFTGPGLDQPVGWVSFTSATGPDRVKIGQVSRRRGMLGKEKWTVTQNGLPELSGERAGVVGSLRDTALVRGVLTSGVADAALSAHLRFSGPGTEGFEFTRQPGLSTRYKVRVYDTRLSWLLVLACVLHYDHFDNADPRKEIAEISANPLKD